MNLTSHTNQSDMATLCRRCAKVTKTCCRHSDIYLTLGDIDRISSEIRSFDFFEFRLPQDPSYYDQEDDPVWASAVFRPDGSRRVVKHDDQGNCSFLGTTGCLLSLEIRPLVCRLHPHLYNFREIYASISSDCPLDLLDPEERIEDLIQGFDQTGARHWHRILYEELSREGNDSC